MLKQIFALIVIVCLLFLFKFNDFNLFLVTFIVKYLFVYIFFSVYDLSNIDEEVLELYMV